jgi:polyisoprenyl-teichoic acid--peptidoglycan teichoic acid transferase
MWCISAQSSTDYRGFVPTDNAVSRVSGVPRWLVGVSIALVMMLAGALGIVRATNSELDKVPRVSVVNAALSPASDGFENYLLVGSDSRAGADVSDGDYASVGDENATPGMRADTLIVIRVDTRDGRVATMSIPRDLRVAMADTGKFGKVNSAYQRGADVLVRTIQGALNIPIHHYVEMDFSGFREIVDAVGGVRICVDHASRDKATGFFLGKRGCKMQNGQQALAYARSRHFEEKIDGRWQVDGTGDVGRGDRQRYFMSVLVKQAIRYLAEHPMETNSVLSSFSSAVAVNDGLDLLDLGRKLRPLADGAALSVALPVSSDMISGSFVFTLNDESQPILQYFAGLGPLPQTSTD